MHKKLVKVISLKPQRGRLLSNDELILIYFRVDQWLADNRMIPNVKKTKSMLIESRQALKKAKNIEIFLDNEKA